MPHSLRTMLNNRSAVATVGGKLVMLYAVYILYVTRTLSLPPAALGLILSTGSVAALAAAPLVVPVVRRAGLGRALIASQAVVGAGSLLIALAMALPGIALALLILAEIVQVGANTIS